MDLYLYLPNSIDYFLFNEQGVAKRIIIPKGKIQELKGNNSFNPENVKKYTRIILTVGKDKHLIPLKKDSGKIVVKQSDRLGAFRQPAVLQFDIAPGYILSIEQIQHLSSKEKPWLPKKNKKKKQVCRK